MHVMQFFKKVSQYLIFSLVIISYLFAMPAGAQQSVRGFALVGAGTLALGAAAVKQEECRRKGGCFKPNLKPNLNFAQSNFNANQTGNGLLKVKQNGEHTSYTLNIDPSKKAQQVANGLWQGFKNLFTGSGNSGNYAPQPLIQPAALQEVQQPIYSPNELTNELNTVVPLSQPNELAQTNAPLINPMQEPTIEVMGLPELAQNVDDGVLAKEEALFLDNPKNAPDKFRPLEGKSKINTEDGSVWERDTAKHGGSEWKMWPDVRSWRDDRSRHSIRADGSVRKIDK